MMKKISFDMGPLKKIPFCKQKYIVKDSCDRKSVTINKTAVLRDCTVLGDNLIHMNVNLCNVHLGRGTYINAGTSLFNTYIGAYSSISSNIKIIDGRHPLEFISTYPGFYSNAHEGIATFSDSIYYDEFVKKKYYEKYSTYIGNDVLICSGAVLMEGIRIEDGAVILPYAVVTNDVEPYAVVGGVPAKKIKYRFEAEEKEWLLNIQWWNKGETWLNNNWKKFLDKEEFFNEYK